MIEEKREKKKNVSAEINQLISGFSFDFSLLIILNGDLSSLKIMVRKIHIL